MLFELDVCQASWPDLYAHIWHTVNSCNTLCASFVSSGRGLAPHSNALGLLVNTSSRHANRVHESGPTRIDETPAVAPL